MGISLFDLIINIIESFIVFLFLSRYFEMKKSFKKIHLIIFTLLFATILTLINIYLGYDGIISIGVSLIFILPVLLIYVNASVIEKVYISLFVYELVSMVATSFNVVFSLIMYSSIDLQRAASEYYYFIVIGTKIVFLFVSQFIANVRRRINTNIDASWISLFVLVSFISTSAYIFMEQMLYAEVFDINAVSISLICLIFVNVFIFVAFFRMQQDNEKILKSELEIQALRFQSDLMETSRKAFQETSKLKHDMRHFLTYVKHLIEEDKQEAIKKVEEYVTSVNETEHVVLTNNEVLNFIFNTKIAQAKLKEITIRFEVNFKKTLQMNEVDLSILLGNILENAIENTAAGQKIDVVMTEAQSNIVLTVRNPLQNKVHIHNGVIKTTKKGKGHGYGTTSVKEIALKNGGEAKFYVYDGMFVCKVLLK